MTWRRGMKKLTSKSITLTIRGMSVEHFPVKPPKTKREFYELFTVNPGKKRLLSRYLLFPSCLSIFLKFVFTCCCFGTMLVYKPMQNLIYAGQCC